MSSSSSSLYLNLAVPPEEAARVEAAYRLRDDEVKIKELSLDLI